VQDSVEDVERDPPERGHGDPTDAKIAHLLRQSRVVVQSPDLFVELKISKRTQIRGR
jgi:hypothetical protein